MKWWIDDGYLYFERKELETEVDNERARRRGFLGNRYLSDSGKREIVRYRVKLEKLLKEPECWK